MSSRSIPILKYDPHGDDRYTLDNEAVSEIFDDFPNIPIMIFSIVGLARQGKSFFLNFVIGYLEHLEKGIDEEWDYMTTRPNCFNWNYGSKRVTVGIHMWSRPFIIKLADGTEVAVLVMDTQGTFDGNTSETECASIFALSTLISSLQVYNIMRDLNESDLQHLARFTAFAKLAGSQAGATSSQHLCFLLRDFPYPKENPYGREGGQQYINDKLKNTRNRTPANIALCGDILSSFKKVTGFNLPKPGDLVETNGGEDCDLSKLNPEFVTHMKEFLKETFSFKKIVLKAVNGTNVRPTHLRQRIEMWSECFFHGNQMPKMKDVYTLTLRIDDDAAMNTAVRQFKQDFRDYIDVTDNWDADVDQLKVFYMDSKFAAHATYFIEPGLGNTDERRLNDIDKLNLQLDEEFKSILLIALKRRNENKPPEDQEPEGNIYTKASLLAGTILLMAAGGVAIAVR